MIFKSRQVNLDPGPWVDPTGKRWPRRALTDEVFDPRPEFEPTRDPEPYTVRGDRNQWRESLSEGQRILGDPIYHPRFKVEWSPRREQFDTPVNPILVCLRSVAGDGFRRDDLLNLLFEVNHPTHVLTGYVVKNASSEQIDHARRVLTRLARFAEVSA